MCIAGGNVNYAVAHGKWYGRSSNMESPYDSAIPLWGYAHKN